MAVRERVCGLRGERDGYEVGRAISPRRSSVEQVQVPSVGKGPGQSTKGETLKTARSLLPKRLGRARAGVVIAIVATAVAVATSASQAATTVGGGTGQGFVGRLAQVSKVASTVPALGKGKPGSGDVNPYAVAVVPRTTGALVAGDVLISNFNNSANLQGTGVTIMQISPSGKASVFADLAGQVSGPIGLTTALVVFRNGDVVVGSLPTTNGKASTAAAGALYVLNSLGKVIETIKGGEVNGPWDMAAYDGGGFGVLFVTNVLNGTVAAGGKTVPGGTVVRVVLDLSASPPRVEEETVVGSGFDEATNAAALVLGPTGAGLSANGTLYVADTMRSRVQAIPDALFRTSSDGTGKTVSAGDFLKGPLGLAIAPNGDILTVNSNDGEITETAPGGQQVNWIFLDSRRVAQGGGDAVRPRAGAGRQRGLLRRRR